MTPDTPEFSRPVEVERLPGEGRMVKISATPEERAALAERFDLQGIDSLEAEITVAPFAGGDMVRLTGHLRAQVTQTCVVSLQPVHNALDERFELNYSFGPPPVLPREMELDADAEEPPEPVVGGSIDVGEAVAEHLALALDPFPRAPGAVLDVPEGVEVDGPEKANPFGVLAELRPKKS